MTNQLAVDIINCIKGTLYIGNSSAANNQTLLKNHDITHMLICCSEIGPSYPEKFEYKKLNIQETFDFNISEFFSEAFEFIQTGINSGGSVFVYCVQGQSRSPTIICSYLMKRYQMSFKTAYKYVKKKHPMTQPNLGFIEQLSDYEKKLHENNPTAVTCSSCNCLIQ